MGILMGIFMGILLEFLMMDSMGFNDCLLFIQEFGTDCFCLVLNLLLTFLFTVPSHIESFRVLEFLFVDI